MLRIRSNGPDYAVVDVETSNLKHGERPKTKFWGYADRDGYKNFKTTKKFADFLRRLPPKVLLHHSNFDIIQLLLDGEYRDFNIVRAHHGRLIECAFAGHKVQNTLTAFPVALEVIFNAFGYEKTSLDDLKKRNYDDCVLALECFLKLDAIFEDLIDVSPLRQGTVAGTTFKAAERTAGKMPMDLRWLECYRGGRVEVFDMRKIRASHFDINSSYPRSFLEVQPMETLLYCEVETKDWLCPFFDSDTEDMLLFPNGKFRTWIYRSNLERYILPNAFKTSVKILNSWSIDCTWLYNLRELVSKLYRMKQEATSEGIKTACKFLLNAFYGRIGLKPEAERVRVMEYIPDGPEVTAYKLGRSRWLCFDTVQREVRSNYPYASFITDNARCRLYEAFALNQPAYGDTDSLFTRNNRRQFTGETGSQLGQWSYKGTGAFVARNVKDYVFNGKITRKGGDRSLTWTFKEFLKGGAVREVTRERRTSLRKRTVNPDGTTEPLVVNN